MGGRPSPSVAYLPWTSKYLVIETRGLHMQLIRVDAYDGTIFLVHASDFECILPVLYNVKVEFIPRMVSTDLLFVCLYIPEGQCRQLGAGKVGDRTEIQTVKRLTDQPRCPEDAER